MNEDEWTKLWSDPSEEFMTRLLSPVFHFYRLCLCILIRLVAEDQLIDGPIQNRFSFCCLPVIHP